MVYRVEPFAGSGYARPARPAAAGGGARLRLAHERRVLAELGLPSPLVAQAESEARRLGVTMDAAILSARLVDEESLYRALARRLGLPFALDATLAQVDNYEAVAAVGLAQVAPGSAGGIRWLAAPRGLAFTAFAGLRNLSGVAVTTPRRFATLLRRASAERIAHDASSSIFRADPRLTARVGPKKGARIAAGLLLALLLALSLVWPWTTAVVAWTALSFAFVIATTIRLFTVAASFGPEPEAAANPDRRLPDYTIVVALYREAPVARALVRALERLDYPRARLDVKFVVESDDPETFAALAASIPGVEYEVVVAPPGEPRTKPRALDIALPFARGELLTVYDAEDEPEPDQLRRAAARFAQADENLGCLQARLAIDNHDDSWIAGLYAVDYAALFEAINPGVAALDFPMLLGGTSNHFRTRTLRAIGGWDAWNVTEDADLGLRLARFGLRVETLRSRTFEEAPNRMAPLLRQRTRWMKGWMQTAFVHLRHPLELWRNLRPLAFLAVVTTFVSGVLSPLLWPILMGGLVVDMLIGGSFRPAGAMAFVIDMLACSLALGGIAAMIWPAILGMRRQHLQHLWPLLLLLPAWHILLCAAAWRAVFDLWRNPFGWAKTTHGLALKRVRADQRQPTSRASAKPIRRARISPTSERMVTPARS